jgi:hypothetical protein
MPRAEARAEYRNTFANVAGSTGANSTDKPNDRASADHPANSADGNSGLENSQGDSSDQPVRGQADSRRTREADTPRIHESRDGIAGDGALPDARSRTDPPLPQEGKTSSVEAQERNGGLSRENEGLKRESAEHPSAKETQDRKNAEQGKEIADLKQDNAGLRAELGDVKAANAERDRKDKIRDAKIAELESRLDKQGSERGDRDGEQSKNSSIDGRTAGGAVREAKAEKPQQGWHLPSDATNSVVAAAIGVAIALDHVPHDAADYGGIGVAVAALSASGVAWVRERMKHRKAKNDEGD